MMSRFAWLVLGLCLLAELATADQPLSLWQVEGKTNTLYLLGSVHLLRESDHPLPAAFDLAYDDAEVVYMEIDMDDVDPVAALAATNRLGVLRGDTTLESLIGEAAFVTAQRSAAAAGIPLRLLQQSEPWLAAMTIEQLALGRLGFSAALGVETKMLERARIDQKPIHGLEELEEQLMFLDTLSLSAQRDMLLQALQDLPDLEQMMDALIAAWRNGDTQFFEETVLADLQQYPELYDVILARRNAAWVEKITALLNKQNDYLMIVGVLHLVGEDGVPALLEKRGYTVSQLAQE